MTVAAGIILISVAIQSNGNSELDKKKNDQEGQRVSFKNCLMWTVSAFFS